MSIRENSRNNSLTVLIDKDNFYNNDHVYEEIKERNELLGRVERFCLKCAGTVGDKNGEIQYVVYSDRLIYGKKSLIARRVFFTQLEHEPQQVLFRLGNSLEQDVDYMPVTHLNKPNETGILYSKNQQDVFYLPTTLAPNIEILDDNVKEIISNTELYHRIGIERHSRLSNTMIFKPMIFKNIRNKNYHYWSRGVDKNGSKLSPLMRKHYHRSSLLLLEPLLMISSGFSKDDNNKIIRNNRKIKNNHNTILCITIAYVLSFVLLVIIMFNILLK